MRNSRRLFLVIELILGILAVGLLVIMFRPSQEEQKVAVILSESDSDAWDHFTLGMKQAAADENLKLVISGTGTIHSAEEERDMILQELDGGAEAFIVQPAPGEDTDRMLAETVGNIPLVLAQDRIEGYPSAGPDFYEAGKQLASMLIEDYAGSLDGKEIGILNRTLNTESAEACENGFLDGIAGSGGAVIWHCHGFGEQEDPGKELSRQPKADIIAARLIRICWKQSGKALPMGQYKGQWYTESRPLKNPFMIWITTTYAELFF